MGGLLVCGLLQTAAAAEGTGACCACRGAGGNTQCSIGSPEDCIRQGGTYLGDGSTCDPVMVRESHPLLLIDSFLGDAVDTVVIEASFVVGEVTVDLEIDHTYVGDLCIRLRKEGFKEITLIERMGGPMTCAGGECCGCSSNNMIIHLEDSAPASIESQCFWSPPALTGSYRPEQPLSGFAHTWSDGAWTLTVTDSSMGDSGALVAWSLNLRAVDEALTLCDVNFPSRCQCRNHADCADDDPCTLDLCDALAGCSNPAVDCPDGSTCVDGWCCDGETCEAGGGGDDDDDDDDTWISGDDDDDDDDR